MKFNQNKAFIILFSLLVGLSTMVKAGGDPKETKVLIVTQYGNIIVKLYNETPKHRDNFIKLVNEHFFDSLLFHRCIQNFMIQGGDPQSKRAPAGTQLGNGDVGYTIPAEFNPKYYHKKGALAAARQGDDVNPAKASSGCQFYIVQGGVFKDADLKAVLDNRINAGLPQQIFSELMNKPEYLDFKTKFVRAQNSRNQDSIKILSQQIDPVIKSEYEKRAYKFSDEQIKAYTTVGGTPHLDNNYTVFGEVVEGLEVIDQIAAQPVDKMARPQQDIRIVKAIIITE